MAILFFKDNSDEEKRRRGLTTLTAAIFIVGEMAGIGVLALPEAVEKTSKVLLKGRIFKNIEIIPRTKG